MRRTRALAGLSLSAAAAVVAVLGAAPGASAEPREDVGGAYIVVLRDAPDPVGHPRPASAAERARGRGAQITHEYHFAIKGFAARLTPAQLAAVRTDPDVAYVEPDGEMQALGDQPGATWGLDRIDQRSGIDGTYHYDGTGGGVTAYVIDTGILTTHTDFGGRARFAANFAGGQDADCNGHGTHVAGTIGGATYGVAKQVSLVAVKVLNCAGSGSTSGVIAGVDWVKNHHVTPAVANMSLGGSASTALDTAVANAIAGGVTFAVAAGNDNRKACTASPARVPTALTVGATDSSDARASYSNYGTCVDLFAPGSSITSDWFTSTNATNTISGTSMASPHVTGVAALYLAAHTTDTPAQVNAALVGAATLNVVRNPGNGSPNRLLYALIP